MMEKPRFRRKTPGVHLKLIQEEGGKRQYPAYDVERERKLPIVATEKGMRRRKRREKAAACTGIRVRRSKTVSGTKRGRGPAGGQKWDLPGKRGPGKESERTEGTPLNASGKEVR